MKLTKLFTGVVAAAGMLASTAHAVDLPDGSKANPLRVMMVPAEVGSQDTISDYKPVFNAITEKYGIHFDIKLGDSYAAVVQGMCGNQADIAWYGPVTFGQAHNMCGSELLAVDVKKGDSVYYSGIYTRRGNGINEITDLKGKSLAVGDPNSTSSFNFPVAMVIAAKVDPAKDLGKVVMAGSHSNSIAALKEGRVDAAAASFNAWEKAIKKGVIDPKNFRVLAKSEPIPNPPLAMSKDLDAGLKARLREAFGNIHKHVSKELVRGYGGKKVDRYDSAYPLDKMLAALDKLAAVTKDVKAAIIDKAGER
jgi:phosphonate transport system substrate-binding protein